MVDPDPDKIRHLRNVAVTSDDSAVEYAVSMLDDPDIRIRGEAFCSLILNPGNIAQVLSENLTNDSPNVRAFCALVLANRDEQEWAYRIVPLINDPAPAVRSCALGAVRHLRHIPAADHVIDALSDTHYEVRLSALAAALKLGIDIPNDCHRTLATDPLMQSMLKSRHINQK